MRIIPDSSAFTALSGLQDSQKRSEHSSAQVAAGESAFIRTLVNGDAFVRSVNAAVASPKTSDQYRAKSDTDRPSPTREAPTRGQRPVFQPKGQSINILVWFQAFDIKSARPTVHYEAY